MTAWLRRFRCWFRGEHRYRVKVEFTIAGIHMYPICEDCGAHL